MPYIFLEEFSNRCILKNLRNYIVEDLMQAFVVDKLTQEELKRLREAVSNFAHPGALDDIFWIPIPEHLLTPIQAAHKECQPLFFAIEFGENFISFEFLARTHHRVRCDCISPATPQQKVYLLEIAKKIFQTANVEMKTH